MEAMLYIVPLIIKFYNAPPVQLPPCYGQLAHSHEFSKPVAGPAAIRASASPMNRSGNSI